MKRMLHPDPDPDPHPHPQTQTQTQSQSQTQTQSSVVERPLPAAIARPQRRVGFAGTETRGTADHTAALH